MPWILSSQHRTCRLAPHAWRGMQKAETVSLGGLKGALVTKDQQLGGGKLSSAAVATTLAGAGVASSCRAVAPGWRGFPVSSLLF